MSTLLITYSSGTTTARLKRLMEKDNRKAEVIQVPKILAKNGCSYGIKTDKANLNKLLELSRAIDVKYRGIYVEQMTSEGKKYLQY